MAIPAHALSSLLRGRLESPENVAPSCQLGDEGCFTLLGVSVVGAVTISPEQLSFSYDKQLAKPTQMSDLVIIADRITQAYRDEGGG